MPRVSAAALAAYVGPDGVETLRRPEPPVELTEEQADEWRAIVNRLAADWFPRETWPLLMQYCRLIVRARRIAQLIDAAEQQEQLDVDTYRDLLRSEQQISASIASLSTKMRLGQSSTMRTETTRKPSMLRKPWESKG